MDDFTQKTNEELFALYKKEPCPQLRQELTMRYLYIATSVTIPKEDISQGKTPESLILSGFLGFSSCNSTHQYDSVLCHI